jgi:hypothetical protein
MVSFTPFALPHPTSAAGRFRPDGREWVGKVPGYSHMPSSLIHPLYYLGVSRYRDTTSTRHLCYLCTAYWIPHTSATMLLTATLSACGGLLELLISLQQVSRYAVLGMQRLVVVHVVTELLWYAMMSVPCSCIDAADHVLWDGVSFPLGPLDIPPLLRNDLFPWVHGICMHSWCYGYWYMYM